MKQKIYFLVFFLSIIIFFSCENNPSFENCNEDNCGICNQDPADDCIEDCDGNWGGELSLDCNGVCGGTAILDCDENCISQNEDGSYDGNFSTMDCNGICDGESILDECGICNGPGDVYQCGCYGLPQQASGGTASDFEFIITEYHDFPIQPNQIFTGQSYNNNTITEKCGILTKLNLNGPVQNIYDIVFYSSLGNYNIPHDIDFYNQNCNEDEITFNTVCSENFPNNTIYINKNDQILYKTSIDISKFTFTIEGATVPLSCDCNGNKNDCNNICGGDNFNEFGCCDNEITDCLSDCNGNNFEIFYDHDSNPETNDLTCPCLVELNEDGCCCEETKDCALVCNGEAVVNDCNICVGGTSGNIDSNQWNTGPFGSDCNGICNGTSVLDCAGICNGTEIDADQDGICDFEDNCIGTVEECTESIDSGCDLSLNTIYILENSSIIYNVDFIISGFQFDVVGGTVLGASGGNAADSGFTVQGAGNTVLGFSFTGSTISAGCGTLTELSLNGTVNSLNGIVFSNGQGDAVYPCFHEDEECSQP